MINQFLQVGGVATLKDFYRKFPTEAHFDHYVKMKYGGGINAYQTGGQPVSSDYPDYATFKAADDAWQASQNMPQVDQSTVDAYSVPVAGANGLPDYLKRSADPAVVAAPAAATTKTKLNPYGGVSIVDFLAAQGKATDKASRKKLAEAMGISDYTGRADQNTKILQMLQNAPELLDQYPDSGSGPVTGGGGGGGRKKAAPERTYSDAEVAAARAARPDLFETDDERQSRQNPFLMPPGPEAPEPDPGWGFLPPTGSGDAAPGGKKSNVPWGAIGAGAFGAGTLAYMLHHINKNTANPRGLFDMANATGGPKALIGDAAFNLAERKAAQAANIPKVNQILSDIKLNKAYTSAQLRELSELGVTKPWIDSFRGGFNKATPTEAAKFVKYVAPKVAAAVPKTAQAASTAAKVAKNPGFWRDVYTAGRESPLIAKLAKLALFVGSKGKKAEYGGAVDDLEMLHDHYKLNYLQNGGYYQDAGQVEDPGAWHVGNWTVPNWLKTTAQIVDPTGMSGYGDAGRSISKAWDDPSFSNILGATFDSLGALPIVGKFGKLAKVAKVAAEAEKVGKLAKVSKAVGKVTNHALYPSVKNLDRINPVGAAWTKAVMPRLVGNSPKIQKVLNFSTPINQANRFFGHIASPLYDKAKEKADNYFGYDNSDYQVHQDGGVSGNFAPDGRALVNAYSHGGYYGNVPQHGNPGVYADGYSGTSNGGQSFQSGGVFGMLKDGMRDGSLPGLAAGVLSMTGNMSGLKSTKPSTNLKDDLNKYISTAGGNLDAQSIQNIVNKYGAGGSFVPTYGDSAYGLPQYSYGSNYQDGGAPQPQGAPQQPQGQPQGAGVDPQQVMQEVAQMLQQGAQPDQIMQQLVQEGVPQDVAQQIIQQVMQQLQGQQGQQQAEQQGPPPQQRYGGYAKGGMTAGTEMDVTPQQMEALKKQGYKFDII
jgi:hypothetical protein